MALKIVRASEDATTQRPLRLWLGGKHDEAVERLADPAAGAFADEARQLISLVLAERPALATEAGAALVAWSDDIAAYRTLRAGVEEVIASVQAVGIEAWPPRAVAAIQLVQPWLEARPAEPMLLNLLGVLLYGVNDAKLAIDVLKAAAALDPETPHVLDNIEAAKERTRRPIRLVVQPSAAAGLKRLRPWLKGAARRATVPPFGGRISLCMIVKDEEELLPACLASVRDGVDELIIVDTGSSDRTVEIAESFGARVLEFPWNGSFSDARNHGLDAATGDWILWLDADEQLEPGDAARLRELAARDFREAFWLVETNFTGQEEIGTASQHLALRLFRNRPAFRFSGAIHEQLRSSMPTDLSERFETSRLRIRHYGYLKSRVEERDKRRRNMELLAQELARDPKSAFNHFNMGTEYTAQGDFTDAVRHFEQAYELIRNEPRWIERAYAPLLLTRLIATRRVVGRVDDADQLAAEVLTGAPEFTDLVYERALCARDRGELDRAEELFQRCLAMGDAPAEFSGSVGRGSFLALMGLAEVAHERGDRAAAAGWYRRSLTDFPSFLPPVFDLAQLELERPDADPESVLSGFDAFGHDELTWHLLLGTAFYEHGHAVQAERLFRAALRRGPSHPAARAGLVEALLTQHRYAEVAEDERVLSVGTPAYLAVERARVLAALLVPDEGAADGGIEALRSGAADAGETDWLRAARAALIGGAAPALTPSAAPYALQTLDALARLEEFDAFGRLVGPAAAAIGDPARAAAALAELYYARGFYRMAADNALQALDLGLVSAQLLAILGKSAVAEGMLAESVDVLEESLRLDPNQPSVRRLLEEVRARTAA